MITLKQLRTFASIARHGSLGPAAEELCLSKGALSQSLRELENQLDTPLFDRVHPHLRLNSEGRQLQPLAEEVLDRIRDIETLFTPIDEPSGRLRIGASKTIGNYILPCLLARMPHLHAEVNIINTHVLCGLLERFELDLALIEGETHKPELTAIPWLEDELHVIAHPGHPLAGEKHLTCTQLKNTDWVVVERNSGTREMFDHQLAPLVEPIGRILELNTLESVMLAVEQGLGLSLISERVFRQRMDNGRIVRLSLDHRFKRPFRIAWNKQKYHSALMRQFIEFCLAQGKSDL